MDPIKWLMTQTLDPEFTNYGAGLFEIFRYAASLLVPAAIALLLTKIDGSRVRQAEKIEQEQRDADRAEALEEKHDKLREQLQETDDRLAIINREKGLLEGDIKALKESRTRDETKIGLLQSQLADANAKLYDALQADSINKTKIGNLETEVAKLTNDLRDLSSRLNEEKTLRSALEGAKERADREIDRLMKQNERDKTEIDRLNRRLNNKESELSSLRTQYNEVMGKTIADGIFGSGEQSESKPDDPDEPNEVLDKGA